VNAPDRLNDWTEANHGLLVAEFALLRTMLGGAGGQDGSDRADAAAQVDRWRAEMPAPAAIDLLVQRFALSGFERALLLLAAGVEMDARLAACCASAAGAPGQPWASFGLALAALPDAHWSAVADFGPLRRWRLLEVDDAAGLTAGRLRIDERVLHFIAGLNHLDARLQPLLTPVVPAAPAAAMSASQRAVVACAAEQLGAAEGRRPALWLSGDDPEGQRDVAAAVAARLGAGLLQLRAADLPAGAAEQAALARLCTREAALLQAAILVTQDEDDADAALVSFVRRVDGLVIVAARHATASLDGALHHVVDRPQARERRALWRAALGPAAIAALGPVTDVVASQYRLGARRIADIARQADGLDPELAAEVLHLASRGEAPALPGLAPRIDARAAWVDLVLPPAQQLALRQIVAHARHRMTVHHDWGFADRSTRGLGLATLFWGDSGTGKTMAAEVLAREIGLALYRIDLSAVVSKYIGETEKNLRRVFDAAEDSGAILLFDEADALFGKRSEVKDSHDRYANIEVSYLLQRMEAFDGLAILTTNHKAALDGAFQRRLRFVVHFPFPDQAQRESIWRTVFPPETPLHGIDWARLARLNVAGGTIRNIALSAAFLAAQAGGPVGMPELLRAAHLEAAKQDRPFSDAETRGWA
jgi:hypothetical protein